MYETLDARTVVVVAALLALGLLVYLLETKR